LSDTGLYSEIVCITKSPVKLSWLNHLYIYRKCSHYVNLNSFAVLQLCLKISTLLCRQALS